MSRKVFEVVLKLLAASLVVGFVFFLLNFNPWSYLGPLAGLSAEVTRLGNIGFQWAWTYVVLGAAVVVPTWLVYVLIMHFRGRG